MLPMLQHNHPMSCVEINYNKEIMHNDHKERKETHIDKRNYMNNLIPM